MKALLSVIVSCFGILACAITEANDYPVTVKSCGRDVVFDHPPARAVSQDVNLTQMLVSLQLQARMVGYAGVTGWNKPSQGLMAALRGLPELATHYPAIETLLSANADFYFAGWNYGMRVGGDVTPQTLAPLGIQVYELTESCAQIGQAPPATLEQVYLDLANLGKIFGVRARAQALIDALRHRQHVVADKVAGKARLEVFVYDSGEDRPFTAGKLAIPEAIIKAAGGTNVMGGVEASWTQVGWESVVQADPQVIVIVDYGDQSATQKERFLRSDPALQSIRAVRDNRFVVLPYSSMTPGVQNLDAIEKLADQFERWR